MPLVAFRVDASVRIGSGHVMRCLALASALRERGAECVFICREQAGDLGERIVSERYRLLRLPAPARAAPEAAWLAVPWQQDADETRARLQECGARPDWLVADNYGIDARWEARVRDAVGAILAIDDLADREHAVDALLDQNIAPALEARYDRLVPAAATHLLGPRFALLQPGYAGLHAQARARDGAVRRILVHFGATDAGGMVARTLDALAVVAPAGIEVDVVPGADPQALAALAARSRPGLRVHGELPSLAPLVATADLAIGAGGTANWERLCLGLPALVVSVADNQRAIAGELDRRGLARYLGDAEALEQSALEAALAQAIGRGSDSECSRRCLAAVDGRGAARVAELLCKGLLAPLVARPVLADDEALLLEWANDEGTRRNAFSPARIEPATHHAWLRARLAEGGDCRFYVLESAGGEALASVRFQREHDEWEVHFALAPAFRGQGLGTRVLAAAMARLQADTMRETVVLGRVKEDNVASRRIFEALGFDMQPGAAEGAVAFRRRLGDARRGEGSRNG